MRPIFAPLKLLQTLLSSAFSADLNYPVTPRDTQTSHIAGITGNTPRDMRVYSIGI